MSNTPKHPAHVPTHNLFALPVENSFYFDTENLPALMDPPEQTPYIPTMPRGIQLVTAPPQSPRVLLQRNGEYGVGSLGMQRCGCGLDKELARLRSENDGLKTELYAFERTFAERLSKELRRKETELLSVYEIKQQSAEAAAKKQVEAQTTVQDDQVRQQYKIYEKYIENLEKGKEALYDEIDKLKKQNQKIQKLENKVRQLQTQKQSLEQSVVQRETEMNQTLAQITMESQYRKSVSYVEELEKTNTFLQKQNKRLNAILLDRIRSGMH